MATYKERRDALCRGLHNIGWRVEPPKGTMFVWATIPDQFRMMGSLEFSKLLLERAKVAVARKLAVRMYWMLRRQTNYTQLVRMQGSSRATLV